MFEGDLAGLVLLNEDLVDLDGRRARGQAQHEGVLCGGRKGFDPVYIEALVGTQHPDAGLGKKGIPMMYLAM
jgi:hypothetical protein